MKRISAYILTLLIILSLFSACSNDDVKDEVTSAPTAVKTKKYDYISFELSGLPENERIPDANNIIRYNEYSFRCDSASIYAYNSLTDEDIVVLYADHPVTLIALCDTNLFFRDLVTSVIYRVELLFDNSVSAQSKALFLYEEFLSFIRSEENKIVFRDKSDTLMQLDTKTGEHSAIEIKLMADFEPFNADGSYYSFQNKFNDYPKSKDGAEYFVSFSDDSSESIMCLKNGSKKTVFSNASDIVIYGIIDDSLYFIANHNNDNCALYRLKLDNAEGNSGISLVIVGNYQPVKAYDNKLIIAKGNALLDAKYYEFDTSSAKINETSYYYSADVNSFSDDVKISADEAVAAAKKELKKSKYFDMGASDGKFEVIGSPQFIVEPHYTFGCGFGYIYEDYPWLIYRVNLNSWRYSAYVDINAQTGVVSFVCTSLND